MNFCRNCGTRLGAATPGPSPIVGAGPLPAPAEGMPRAASSPPVASPPVAGPPVTGAPDAVAGPPVTGAPDAVAGGSALAAPTQLCPHCGARTPAGFAFCQQCGKRLEARAADLDAMAPTVATPHAPAATAPQAPAYAASHAEPGAPPMQGAPVMSSMAPARSALGDAPWGALISVNRDGSDGERHALAGEWIEIGQGQADISFPDDRFLARKHARIELTPGGARVVPLDSLNGVLYRLREPTPLEDGDVLLLGRELMRFELVDSDEREPTPLVRHGVALFGSPPREPWGRLVQLLASGGVRDVRHLHAPVVTVGREEGDLVFRDDQFLSRRHATLSWKSGTGVIEDLGSSNGTFLRQIGPRSLRSGDQLRMGDQVFRFERLP